MNGKSLQKVNKEETNILLSIRFLLHVEILFCKKHVFRNFAKLTGKHLCQSLFFNVVAGLIPITLLKKRLGHRCFLVNLSKFLRTPFIIE